MLSLCPRLRVASACIRPASQWGGRHASLTRAIDKGARRGRNAADRHVGRSNSFNLRSPRDSPRTAETRGSPGRHVSRQNDRSDSTSSRRSGMPPRDWNTRGRVAPQRERFSDSKGSEASTIRFSREDNGTRQSRDDQTRRQRVTQEETSHSFEDYTPSKPYSRAENSEERPSRDRNSRDQGSRYSERQGPSTSKYSRNVDRENGAGNRTSGWQRSNTRDRTMPSDGHELGASRYGITREVGSSPFKDRTSSERTREKPAASDRDRRRSESSFSESRDRGKDHERWAGEGERRKERAAERNVQHQEEVAGGDWKSQLPKHMKDKALTQAPESVPYTTAASEFLYGTFATKAALQANRRIFHKLYVFRGMTGVKGPEDVAVQKLALAHGVKIREVAGPQWEQLLDKMAKGAPHNGYVLEAGPLPRLPVVSLATMVENGQVTINLGAQGEEEKENTKAFGKEDVGSDAVVAWDKATSKFPLFLFLDRIVDPGNLGAILRSAYYFGVAGVVIVTHGSAPFSPVTIKSSAGAAEFVPIFEVKNDVEFIKRSKQAGWKFVAATPSDPFLHDKKKKEMDRRTSAALQEHPVVLMLGNEGEGLRPRLQNHANASLSIAGSMDVSRFKLVDSLNVSVAAAVLMQQMLAAGRAVGETQPSISIAPAEDSTSVF